MLTFASYFAQVLLISGLLFSYYLVVLRNKKFHQYNRFYLLATVLLSLILPLIKFHFLNAFSAQPVVRLLSTMNSTTVYVSNVMTTYDFLSQFNLFLFYAFLTISAAFLITLISQVLQIFLLVKGNPKRLLSNVCLVFTKTKGTPFSFFKYIFLDENINIESRQGQAVLQHELAHVTQHHSADKLFLNIVLTVCWANPFFWLIRNELNITHEFIADKRAISNSDSSAFASMLLTSIYPQHASVLTNSFFHSPIKRRLIMLTTSKTTRYSYMRRLMVLPLVAIITVVTGSKLESKKDTGENQKFAKASEQTSTQNSSDTITPKFPGGNDGWRKYLERNLNANVAVEDKAPAGIYTVKVQFMVLETGYIKNIRVEKIPAECPSCAVEAVRCIAKGPMWNPMTINGKSVSAEVAQYLSFQVDDKK